MATVREWLKEHGISTVSSKQASRMAFFREGRCAVVCLGGPMDTLLDNHLCDIGIGNLDAIPIDASPLNHLKAVLGEKAFEELLNAEPPTAEDLDFDLGTGDPDEDEEEDEAPAF